jgi:hypothetical protein
MTLEERQAWREQQPTALYRLYDEAGVLLYVGITYDVAERWRHHRRNKAWWPQAVHKQLVWFDTRREAAAAEDHAIVTGNPLHNEIKNWVSFKASYRIQWLGARLLEERTALCTPRRPRAKGKLARVAEVEAQLRRLEDHAPQYWSAWHWQKPRTPRQMMEDVLAGRGPTSDLFDDQEPIQGSPLEASRRENGECPLCGFPVPCPLVKAMGEPYRDHPFYCL